MKLLSISISFFRGFCDCSSISLDSPLVIFLGSNGSGKTSIAEALEWLFFGTTQRRLHSDVDEVEHRGALRNALCPEGTDPFVEVQVRLRDNSTHTLRRTLHIDGTRERSIAYVDGIKVPDFTSVRLVDAEHFYPIIVQHNLQELILSSGTTRRKFISCLLGLEPLLSYERAVDAANNRFMSSLPQDIAECYSSFQKLGTTIGQRNMLQDLHQKWTAEQVEYPADWNEVLNYCRAALQIPGATPDNIQSQAGRRADEARRAIFDITPFAPRQNLRTLTMSYDQHISQVQTNFVHLRQSLANYAAAKAQIYAQLQFTLDPKRLEFWRTGLGFLDVSAIPLGQAVQCPFCEELTITRDKTKVLRERLDRTDQYTQTRKHLQEVIKICHDHLERLIATANSLLPSRLDETARDRLTAILPNNLEGIQTFSDSIDATYKALNTLDGRIQSVKATFDNLLTLADDPDQAEVVAAFVQDTPTTLRDEAQTLRTKFEENSTKFVDFSAILQPALSSDETVRQFELIQYLTTTQHTIFVASEVLRLRDQLREARQAVREFLNNEDRKRIQQCDNEIKEWFELLYGGDPEVIQFGSVDPRGTAMRFLANILGEPRYASTHFSQSQLNCLGLALHIVSATANDCPFDFVLFDDPIQSFDDEHRERLLDSAVPCLLDELDKQVIVLTYSHNLADRLRYGNERRGPLYHRFLPFSGGGIQVEEFNRLWSDSQDIRRRARGDDVERTVACQRLRTFVEHIVKAIYQAETGKFPPEYEDRTGPNLVILLESIPRFPRPELDYIRESLMFGVKPSHDDPTWHPPDTTTIAQRMDRLEQIGRNHGLKI